VSHRWIPLISSFFLVCGASAASAQTDRIEELEERLTQAAEVNERLRKDNARLREFYRESLVGTRYPSLSIRDRDARRGPRDPRRPIGFPDHDTYRDCEIVSVDDEYVTFKHREGTTTVEFRQGPREWQVLNPAIEAALVRNAKVARPLPSEHSASRESTSRAIVVIEGDEGAGTGFLVRDGDQVHLYTAAHVLSGNSRLTVKLRDGTKLTKFGTFEASTDSDLVRIELLDEVEDTLALTAEVSQVDRAILAAGNSGGAGTVGFEPGVVKSLGAESVEIDADVIQGNSGGPILDANTLEVVGLVTHLIAARRDEWAKETRFSDIRRFGCRLDRDREWVELSIGRFLAEGRAVGDFSELNTIIALSLYSDGWDSPELRAHSDHPIVREVRSLQEWIRERRDTGVALSESDRKRRVAALLRRVQATARSQERDFKPERYTWFHREMGAAALEWREELIENASGQLDKLR